jgi:hypothetical protein
MKRKQKMIKKAKLDKGEVYIPMGDKDKNRKKRGITPYTNRKDK